MERPVREITVRPIRQKRSIFSVNDIFRFCVYVDSNGARCLERSGSIAAWSDARYRNRGLVELMILVILIIGAVFLWAKSAATAASAQASTPSTTMLGTSGVAKFNPENG